MSTILNKGDDKLYLSSFNRLISSLDSYGIKPDGDTTNGLSELVYHYSLGLRGLLKPSYYLSSLDPGAGKTESISSFIKAWKETGFEVKGSILICVNSRDQIESLIGRLDLSADDYSCLTSDEGINALGLGKGLIYKAPVLITTQQMVISRTTGRSFNAAKDFHFYDKPRTLRIWDETITLAQQLSITVAALHTAAGTLSRAQPSFANGLADFAARLIKEDSGTSYQVPVAVADEARAILTAVRGKDGPFRAAFVTEADQRTLDSLARAGGQSLRLGDYGGSASLKLIGSTKPLPVDFAPAIILDASGRVRGTYSHMEASGVPLVRLHASANDYSAVTIHLWRTASGMEALTDNKKNRMIFAEIAKAIETHPRDEWLIIGPKANDGLDVLALIEASLPAPALATAKLHYVHWGIHMATNAYKHIRRVIVVGSHHYGNAGYDALASAAAGIARDPLNKVERKNLRVYEYKHNLLQALTRSNARNAKNGKAGECVAYVLTSKDIPVAAILDTFPGINLAFWNEPIEEPTTKQQALIDYLHTRLSEGASLVSKREAVAAIGINPKSLSKILKEQRVIDAMAALSVTVDNKAFRRR